MANHCVAPTLPPVSVQHSLNGAHGVVYESEQMTVTVGNQSVGKGRRGFPQSNSAKNVEMSATIIDGNSAMVTSGQNSNGAAVNFEMFRQMSNGQSLRNAKDKRQSEEAIASSFISAEGYYQQQDFSQDNESSDDDDNEDSEDDGDDNDDKHFVSGATRGGLNEMAIHTLARRPLREGGTRSDHRKSREDQADGVNLAEEEEESSDVDIVGDVKLYHQIT